VDAVKADIIGFVYIVFIELGMALTNMSGMKLLRSRVGNFVISNLPIIIALIMLSSTPFLLLQNEENIANQYAGYAFYLLAVGILWKIIQYLRDNHRHKNNISIEKLKKGD
jgi:hypothetical protein